MRTLCLLALLLLASPVVACDYATLFVRSYHFERKPEYNEANYGLGCEFVDDERWRYVGGFYRNTQRHTSIYAGTTYTPLSVGHWKLGVFLGVITGYGDPLVLPIPLITYERNKWGVNLTVVPPTKARIDSKTEGGVVGFQLKWKID